MRTLLRPLPGNCLAIDLNLILCLYLSSLLAIFVIGYLLATTFGFLTFTWKFCLIHCYLGFVLLIVETYIDQLFTL